MLLIGSNNTLTYLEPSSWWLKLFRWVGRQQERSYDVQYTFNGVRMYDLRIGVDNNNRLIAKNGNYCYPLNSFYEMLDYFDKREDVTVLITLDMPLSSCTQSIEAKFKNTCKIVETIYKHIGFCGGYRRCDKNLMYQFDWEKEHGIPTMICPDEWSRAYRFVSRWLPFWVKKFNKMFIDRYNGNDGHLMLNYVNRR